MQPAASEAQIHAAVVAYCHRAMRPGVVVHHSPNEGKRTRWEGAQLARTGVMTGFPDLLFVADGRAYGLEIKTTKGRLTPPQAIAHDRLAEAGMKVAIARSVDEAVDVLRGWNLVREDARLVNRARLDAEVLTP